MHVKDAPTALRMITHNIRYATNNPSSGEAYWPARLPLILETLQFHTLHTPEAFICLQEALHGQLHDILSGLNAQSLAAFEAPLTSTPDVEPSAGYDPPEWAYLGVGRDDGVAAGEYEPILYRPAIYKLLERVHVWLSETPEIPGSKGWDAASVRMATLGVFLHKESGKEIVLCNTHLDDQGHTARREGAWLLCELLHGYLPPSEPINESPSAGSGRYNGRVIMLAGDLNSTPQGEAYAILSGQLNSRSQSRVHFLPQVFEHELPGPVPRARSPCPNFMNSNWQFPSYGAVNSSRPGDVASRAPGQQSSPRLANDLSQYHKEYSPLRAARSERTSEDTRSYQSSPYYNMDSRTNSPRRSSHPPMSDYGFPKPTRINSPVTDVRDYAQHCYGDTMTFTGFRGKKRDKQHLDFVFVGPSTSTLAMASTPGKRQSTQASLTKYENPNRESRGLRDHIDLRTNIGPKKRGWDVKSYAVLPNRFEDGVWMSDHRALVADLVLT